jgi:hypothetical protein
MTILKIKELDCILTSQKKKISDNKNNIIIFSIKRKRELY